MGLGSLTRPELILSDLSGLSGLSGVEPAEALRAFAARFAKAGMVKNEAELFRRLWEREQISSTGIGEGIAIPHCKMPGLRQPVLAVGIAPQGIDFGAADGKPVKLVFCVVSPEAAPSEHLRVLAAISRWIKADRHAERILELEDAAAVYRFLQEEVG